MRSDGGELFRLRQSGRRRFDEGVSGHRASPGDERHHDRSPERQGSLGNRARCRDEDQWRCQSGIQSDDHVHHDGHGGRGEGGQGSEAGREALDDASQAAQARTVPAAACSKAPN